MGMSFSVWIPRRSEQVVANLAETDGILVTFGVPIYHEGALYNCAVLAKDREILGITAKKRLARRDYTMNQDGSLHAKGSRCKS